MVPVSCRGLISINSSEEESLSFVMSSSSQICAHPLLSIKSKKKSSHRYTGNGEASTCMGSECSQPSLTLQEFIDAHEETNDSKIIADCDVPQTDGESLKVESETETTLRIARARLPSALSQLVLQVFEEVLQYLEKLEEGGKKVVLTLDTRSRKSRISFSLHCLSELTNIEGFEFFSTSDLLRVIASISEKVSVVGTCSSETVRVSFDLKTLERGAPRLSKVANKGGERGVSVVVEGCQFMGSEGEGKEIESLLMGVQRAALIHPRCAFHVREKVGENCRSGFRREVSTRSSRPLPFTAVRSITRSLKGLHTPPRSRNVKVRKSSKRCVSKEVKTLASVVSIKSRTARGHSKYRLLLSIPPSSSLLPPSKLLQERVTQVFGLEEGDLQPGPSCEGRTAGNVSVLCAALGGLRNPARSNSDLEMIFMDGVCLQTSAPLHMFVKEVYRVAKAKALGGLSSLRRYSPAFVLVLESRISVGRTWVDPLDLSLSTSSCFPHERDSSRWAKVPCPEEEEKEWRAAECLASVVGEVLVEECPVLLKPVFEREELWKRFCKVWGLEREESRGR